VWLFVLGHKCQVLRKVGGPSERRRLRSWARPLLLGWLYYLVCDTLLPTVALRSTSHGEGEGRITPFPLAGLSLRPQAPHQQGADCLVERAMSHVGMMAVSAPFHPVCFFECTCVVGAKKRKLFE
jgi:hypothetical protein